VDSIGEKLYPTCRLVAHASAALAQAGLRPGSVLGSGPPFIPHSPKIGPRGGGIEHHTQYVKIVVFSIVLME